jgi:hypothetical protein
VSLKKLITTILLVFVGFQFLIYFTPTIESSSTSNITNPLVVMFFTMAKWLIPVGGLIGLFFAIFKLFGGGSKGKLGE